MKIFLIGFMTSGKSFWGSKLATALNYNWVDLDQYIIENEKMSISAIFEEKGEDFFRNVECQYLKKILSLNRNIVLSCGGGTPCFFDNLKLMKESGKVIYLHINDLLKHKWFRNNDVERPLMTNFGSKSKLLELYIKRQEFYKKAHKIIDVEILNDTNFTELFLKP